MVKIRCRRFLLSDKLLKDVVLSGVNRKLLPSNDWLQGKDRAQKSIIYIKNKWRKLLYFCVA
jgi:hypothetical protein